MTPIAPHAFLSESRPALRRLTVATYSSTISWITSRTRRTCLRRPTTCPTGANIRCALWAWKKRLIAGAMRTFCNGSGNVPGESGDPGSPHYSDLLEDWAAGRYHPMPFSRRAVEAATVERILLAPR